MEGDWKGGASCRRLFWKVEVVERRSNALGDRGGGTLEGAGAAEEFPRLPAGPGTFPDGRFSFKGNPSNPRPSVYTSAGGDGSIRFPKCMVAFMDIIILLNFAATPNVFLGYSRFNPSPHRFCVSAEGRAELKTSFVLWTRLWGWGRALDEGKIGGVTYPRTNMAEAVSKKKKFWGFLPPPNRRRGEG